MSNRTTSVLKNVGRDTGPFHVQLDGLEGAAAQLDCLGIARIIPGKRIVCSARWKGEAVFAKFYLGGSRARVHWNRELEGLGALQSYGILCPALLYQGTVDSDSAKVVILEAISERSFLEVWHDLEDDKARRSSLKLLIETIARQHMAGLEHKDPHLDNFLLADHRIYTLDGGDVVGSRGPLQFSSSINNLGLVLAQLEPRFDGLMTEAFAHYCRQRSWQYGSDKAKQLTSRVIANRNKRLQHYLAKVFRECTEFVCRKDSGRLIVYRREWESKALWQLLSDPDASLGKQGSRILKDGNTCTVWSTLVDGRRLVIKRYNIKNFLHGLSRALRDTRAAHSWKNAHCLRFYGVASVKPVALLEHRWGFLRGKAYFVAEEIEGTDSMQWLQQHADSPEQLHQAINRIVTTISELAELGISHGDMKASNIVFQDGLPAWIDLDAMRQHSIHALFLRQHHRDLRRFIKNWDEQPVLQQQIQAAVESAGLPL